MNDWIEEALGISQATFNRILASVITVAVVLLVRWLAVRAINGRTGDPASWFRTRKATAYVTGVLVTARILIEARDRSGTDDRMWRAAPGPIDGEPAGALAYPTVRTRWRDPVDVRTLS